MKTPPTHVAIPINVARAARAVLGKLPHNEIAELLAAWDSEARTVNVDPKEATDGQPS